jgi:hypothetical protein
MVESTPNAPDVMRALQNDSAAPLATAQPSLSLPTLKFLPIIAAVGLLVFVLMVDGAVIVVTLHFIGLPTFKAMPWIVLYFGHTGMLVTALPCIALLGHGRFREFGFKARPRVDQGVSHPSSNRVQRLPEGHNRCLPASTFSECSCRRWH